MTVTAVVAAARCHHTRDRCAFTLGYDGWRPFAAFDVCLSVWPSKIKPCKRARERGKREIKTLASSAAYQAIATCWANCPTDPGAQPATQQVTQFCLAASEYATTNSAVATATGAKVDAAAAQSTTASSSASASVAATASSKGAAGSVATPVAGAVALVLGAVALL
ncbi:hypothetical protein ANO11243_009250 [Dothideomycetidae sp. 11243]|nr:hypothetical protein ANO11243_009250 [fungal sp. No.11243]